VAVQVSQKQRMVRTFLKNRTAAIGLASSSLIILIAILAPWITPYDPLEQDVYNSLASLTKAHLLGTDRYGRDVLSRVLFGLRISLFVSVISVVLGMIIGSGMGMVAAYHGGKVEAMIMRFIDVLMTFPDEVFGIMFMVAFGSGMSRLILAISILMVPRFARLAYGPVLAIKESSYIDAARALGASETRILMYHILPNVFGELLVMSTLWIGTAISIAASLSFLGLGIPPPTPTLGGMVKTGVPYLATAPWVSVFPGLAITLVVLSFNMLGDGLRDIADPKLRV